MRVIYNISRHLAYESADSFVYEAYLNNSVKHNTLVCSAVILLLQSGRRKRIRFELVRSEFIIK